MHQEISTFITDKKNSATLLFLTLMLVILPLGIVLIKQQQIFFSRAAGETIKIGTGRCIEEKDGKKVLICNEIPLLMTAPFDPNATPTPSVNPSPTANPNGLVAYWKFDETAGSIVNDSVGPNDGVATGATIVDGKFGKARQFTAGNSIDAGISIVPLPQDKVTVSAWVKPTIAAGSKVIIERWTTNSAGAAVLELKDGSPSASIKTTDWIACQATTALTGTSWEMVTASYDGANIKVYINGVLNKTCPATGQIAASTGNIRIGTSTDAAKSWIGGIDEVMVFNRALSAAQIQALVSNTLPTAHIPMQSTLAGFISNVGKAIIPEVVAYDENKCAGDITPGVGGLIQVTTNGCGEVLNYSELLNSCVQSATIRYKPPIWNATKKEWETIKQDGTIFSQTEMKSRQNPLFPIKISEPGQDPPFINCQVYFEYSGRNDCDIEPQKNANGLPMGRENTELNSGQEFTMNVFKATANPRHQEQPDCKQSVEVELKTAGTTPTPTPTTPSPTPTGATPVPTASPAVSPGQCTAGTFGSAQMELPNGCGTAVGIMPVGASTGTINYTAPNITSDAVCNLKVFTNNNGDCKLDSGGKGTNGNPLKPNESMILNFTNACVDNAPGCNTPIVISSAAAIPTDKAAYKLAESETGLNAALERGFNTQTFSTTYTLADEKPGLKTIYVQYINKRTGEKKTDFTTIEFVEKKPLIKQVGCKLDIEKNAVNFDISGLRFGLDGARASANRSELDVTKHTDSTMTAILKNIPAAGDQIYKVKVTKKDGTSSEEVQCRIGISQISLGAKLYCRGQGKFNLANVKLIIIDDQNKKTEETTSITNDGVITGLKTKFETGKNYTISIDAPSVLRKNISFTAKEGTTVITKDDGTTLILPVGDIYPITTGGDGTINALDQAELKRQWRNVESTNTATLTADFNQDKRVNAFDWSCMRKDFGSSDDSAATSPSKDGVGVNFNNPNSGGSGSSSNPGTITVEFGVPSPNPNVSPVPGSTPDDTTGVSNEEPKRFIQGN